MAAGKSPTREAVESATRQTIAARRQATAQRDTEVNAFVAEHGPDTAAWVRRHRSTHGHGPLRSELRRALELEHRQMKATIRALESEGRIRISPETHSMRPGPRASDA